MLTSAPGIPRDQLQIPAQHLGPPEKNDQTNIVHVIKDTLHFVTPLKLAYVNYIALYGPQCNWMSLLHSQEEVGTTLAVIITNQTLQERNIGQMWPFLQLPH